MKIEALQMFLVTARHVAEGESSTFDVVWKGEAYSPEHAVYRAGIDYGASCDTAFPMAVEVEDWHDEDGVES